MSVLVGGVAGAQARIGGGLSSTSMLVADVQPTPLQRIPASLGMRDGPTVGRFRRSLAWKMTDLLLAPLAGVTVLIFDWTTKLLVAQLTSDTLGMIDFSIYAEGTTYFFYANKAASPEVFAASSNQVVPV